MRLTLAAAVAALTLGCGAGADTPLPTCPPDLRVATDPGGHVYVVNGTPRAIADLTVAVGGREHGAATAGHQARIFWLDAGERRDVTADLHVASGDRWRPATMRATSATIEVEGFCRGDYTPH